MADGPPDSRARSDKVWSPEFVHILAKPTGAICNLGCAYCYYLDKEALYPGDRFRMSDEVAEMYVRQTIQMHRTPEVSIAWQGGEPTLMGVGFFRKVMAMEKQYQRPGQSILNSIQTNGTLLTDEWCEFLAEHDFLVGISIDGPQPLHDAYRVDKRGGGSFEKVMMGLRLLQKHGVKHNILTTVNRVNGDYPLDVYRFHRDELNAEWIQFIPIVERVGPTGKPEDMTGHDVSERSVLPEQFGIFLATVFDEWVRNDVGRVFVQTFEAAVANWAGMPSSGLCVFDETCGRGVALEHNGDLYSCDHYVDPELPSRQHHRDPDRGSRRRRAPAHIRSRQTRLPTRVLPQLRRALRLPGRVPEEPIHDDTRRRAGLELPVRRLQALLPTHRPPDETDAGGAALWPSCSRGHGDPLHRGCGACRCGVEGGQERPVPVRERTKDQTLPRRIAADECRGSHVDHPGISPSTGDLNRRVRLRSCNIERVWKRQSCVALTIPSGRDPHLSPGIRHDACW